MEKLVNKIIEILKEKDYSIAASELKKISGLDGFGTENFLHDIILERWVYTPQDIPFSFARQIWGMETTNIEKDTNLLKKILGSPIAEINKAKLYDFLWIEERNYNFAVGALIAYKKHLESTDEFELNFFAINRLVYISKKINSKEITNNIRQNLIRKVLEEYNNLDHGKILNLLKTAVAEKIDTEYLLKYAEKILADYNESSYDFWIIGEFCDLLEQLYCRKNGWKKEHCTAKPELERLRRRKAKALLMASDYSTSPNSVDIMRKVRYQKDIVNLLKTISGTESERKNLLMEIDTLEKEMVSSMPVLKSKKDNTEIVKLLLQQLEVLDKNEALCYFASFIPFPEKQRNEEIIKKTKGFVSDLFPVGILGQDGKSIAKSRPIKKGNNEIDEEAFQEKLEQTTAETINFLSQMLIGNTLNYIRCHFTIEEDDIRRVIEESAFVPPDRKESYLKGIMAGFSGDFLTALYILVPQVENSLRKLAITCGEPVYNLNENGIEELKTMHAILELDGVKEKLDEDFWLSLKTIFCSKFGLNMRNNIAHGMFSDNQLQSYEALYTWWAILKMCYMFCGKLQVENRIKVNNKLKKLYGDNRNN